MSCTPPDPASPLADLPAPRQPSRLRQKGDRPMGTLSEVFSDSAADGAATGFVLAQLPLDGPVLWVQDRLSRREAGMPCMAGLPEGFDPIYVTVPRPVDVLWALEQGLGAAGLVGAIGEVWGDPPQLDFTASKRLALRAEAQGVPCWLMRRAATPALSAARERWRVGSLPSLPDPDDSRAPGQPLWRAELFRSRFRAPASWVARHEEERGLVLEHGIEAGREAAPGGGPEADIAAGP
ncbi:ImuA family protein [Wenxinia saemankumensis]|uniref:Protein ImuA n=1 Tax=Wenxinia saemankumensis TaxID=1447782 RepID=A0A1M6AYP8_9RHOB|nr:hypothetical protein [Wenxinia saemankumensis]SHI41557.1 protein ImuA [Wenxinia saemankumensis]